ncbi:MAG TPA: DNA polymerase III subunit gamma/tau [Solirubrobacteraceae bacterium]|nr:DNA polymerase III subunit gamma/tau [Solirubrobacteraceae bacterium]
MPEAPSLYRRHRPRTFSDVVGQEPIVRTLRNAVEQDKVHHAYLFVGSRGTGKTSMAKILAACLNCETGPTTEPCGRCESCTAIAAATSLDVIEMDAASNNSVDDIRDLRERVAFAPVSGRSKVYILDEAHMLSPQAWNAFLKTLEEPPPHTIFVLCTTEAGKVLPTVVDRCHRFDFARPSAEQVSHVLRRAADAEGIDLPDAARALIARKATGSFRDALGNLEQLVTYSGPQVALDDVLAVLGVADAELLFECADAVAAGDPARTLRAVARLAESGRDPGSFFEDLEDHARGLLVVQALGEVPPELRMTPELDERLAEQSGTIGRAAVVRLLDLLAQGREARKAGADARVQLELALVKAAAPDLDPSQRALLARIERLEAALAGGGRAAPVQPPPAAPKPTRSEPQASAAVAVAVAVEPEEEEEPVEMPALSLDVFRSDMWPAVVETVRQQNAMLAALLEGANPVELAAGELRLAFAESAAFLKRKAEGIPNRQTLGEAVQTVTGRTLKLVYELRSDAETEQAAEAALSEEELFARFMEEFDAEELT